MKANELRTGNYIFEPKNENTNPFKVWSVYQDPNNEKINGYNINYFEPVPLTEEWWPKFGYECIQEFIVDLIDKSIHPISNDISIWVATLSSLPIHKIQNLWYELTNKELKIK